MKQLTEIRMKIGFHGSIRYIEATREIYSDTKGKFVEITLESKDFRYLQGEKKTKKRKKR